ncbi:hypothetical protein Sango_0277500 [Sesamum angolense]|uniref:Uncharacterized protein n=1 Tax=Sesamum angolense TaxID=2727404 RepID=A0AAE1X844_9LAMI|nr:hypothetical protein Sango_0277500 [Sesamum angolense]
MQSRLAATAAKFNLRGVISGHQKKFLAQRLCSATSSGRTADPAEHAVDPDEVYATEAIQDEKLRHSPEQGPTTKDNDPYVPPKSPLESASKLESGGVGPRTDPIAQQKRRNSASTAQICDVSCAGMDGSPWPDNEKETDRKEQREEQLEDDREYFKHHKASPLSEIEIADTRKPISRATDGTGEKESVGGGGATVWRPEQLDTAEESLRRAMEIFRWNAMRGDPDSPHGRVLRQLRGEYW